MNISQHAARILAAWNAADSERFERELEAALVSCRCKPAGFMEMEQQELLETVVERLRLMNSTRRRNSPANDRPTPSTQGLNAGFALLQHLSHRAAA